MQPQGHTQVASRILASGQNPQAAIDAPRWRVEDGEVWIETAMPAAAADGLRRRGHRLIEKTLLDFGAAQVLLRIARGYAAASEGRRDGMAVGF
jgi:gamma-glutamyltranspeptidase/glutathione hydrolase